jgi:endonuclease-3
MSTPIDQLRTLIEFRRQSEAPVDTMGCSKVGDQTNAKVYRFQTLIGLMLSAQTKDAITSKAVNSLKTLKGGLTPQVLSHTDEEIVQELIRPVSFFRVKAARIIKVAGILDRDYDGDIPHTMEELTALPGVGIKMATLAMAHAWHEEVGIGVDVHVHRIANRLGWCETKHPDKTEIALQAVFPKELWDPLNETIVGFGQTICSARKPKCDHCPIAANCAYHEDIENVAVPRKRAKKKVKSESEAESSEEEL